jgi:hypothetical protein
VRFLKVNPTLRRQLSRQKDAAEVAAGRVRHFPDGKKAVFAY